MQRGRRGCTAVDGPLRSGQGLWWGTPRGLRACQPTSRGRPAGGACSLWVTTHFCLLLRKPLVPREIHQLLQICICLSASTANSLLEPELPPRTSPRPLSPSHQIPVAPARVASPPLLAKTADRTSPRAPPRSPSDSHSLAQQAGDGRYPAESHAPSENPRDDDWTAIALETWPRCPRPTRTTAST